MRKDNVSVKNVKTINTQTGEVKQRRVETTTLDEKPSIWNLQAFVIVFLFIMLATTINVYSVNNDNLTWVDSNGDFKLDSYNHSMINLDTPLDDLNGYSLNDVFNDGNLLDNHDFENGISGWTTLFASISWSNGKVLYTNTSDYRSRIGRSLNTISGHKYYFNWFFETDDVIISSRIYLGSYNNVSHDNGFNSYVGTSTYTYSTFIHRIKFATTSESVLIDDYHAVDMTDFGIENLTQSQMDEYYNLYLSLQENRIEAYKDLGNEPISQWQNLTQVLSDIMDAVAGPITDTIDWIDKFMFGLFS